MASIFGVLAVWLEMISWRVDLVFKSASWRFWNSNFQSRKLKSADLAEILCDALQYLKTVWQKCFHSRCSFETFPNRRQVVFRESMSRQSRQKQMLRRISSGRWVSFLVSILSDCCVVLIVENGFLNGSDSKY